MTLRTLLTVAAAGIALALYWLVRQQTLSSNVRGWTVALIIGLVATCSVRARFPQNG